MITQRIRLNQIKSNSAKYQHFEEQLAGMSVPFFQEFVADNNQSYFVLDTDYTMGNNSLKVFLNGMYLDESETGSYVEINKNTVKFNEPLVAGDKVIFRIEGVGGGTTLEGHIHHVREVPFGTIDGANKTFILSYSPQLGTEHLFKNGMLMFDGVDEDYTISGEVITFSEPPLEGSKILVTYMQ